MSRLVHALPVAYAAGALYLARCALASLRQGSPPYAAGLAACSLLLVAATAHHYLSRAEVRIAVAQLEIAARPFTTAQDVAVARLMTTPCCEAWWPAVGGEHQCTRKDQTT